MVYLGTNCLLRSWDIGFTNLAFWWRKILCAIDILWHEAFETVEVCFRSSIGSSRHTIGAWIAKDVKDVISAWVQGTPFYFFRWPICSMWQDSEEHYCNGIANCHDLPNSVDSKSMLNALFVASHGLLWCLAGKRPKQWMWYFPSWIHSQLFGSPPI